MVKTMKATYAAGKLALAEPLPLRDGETVDVTVTTPSAASERSADAIRETSGAWADLLDCDAFERSVYERRHQHRAPVQL